MMRDALSDAPPLTCSAKCARRTGGFRSKSCPFARDLEPKYHYWQTARPSSVQEWIVETKCGEVPLIKELMVALLGGKHVVMVGDSTMRQTYLGLLCMAWEEGLIGNAVKRAHESKETRIEMELKGYIHTELPELGDGTNFTYVRIDSRQPGPTLMSILDTADVTVANLAMHYSLSRVERDAGNASYFVDVPYLLGNISRRGRPGHRAFWREAIVCPRYGEDKTGYGCVPEPNPSLRMHNEIVRDILPQFTGVEVLPVSDLYLPFWWAHPGGHDCCHMVNQMPGLLSATSRLLLAMLSQPAGQPLQLEADTQRAFCAGVMDDVRDARKEDLWLG